MRKHLLILLTLSFFPLYFSFAQTKKITGKVTATSGEELPSVSITIKGKQSATTLTNTNGDFQIQADENDILLFSLVGYTNKEEAVKGRSLIQVILSEDQQNLDEVVVVVGYGTQKKVT